MLVSDRARARRVAADAPLPIAGGAAVVEVFTGDTVPYPVVEQGGAAVRAAA